jgi:hypothetical protein
MDGDRFEYDAGYPDDVECVVCLNPWTKPLEIQPCGHIFCLNCIETVPKCPSCRGDIVSRREPNRVLRNIVNSLPGRCTRCNWKGVRGQFLESHAALDCTPAPAASTPAPVPTAASRHDSPGVAGRAAQSDVRRQVLAEPEFDAQGFFDDAARALDQPTGSDILSAPDSTAAFMAFFSSAQGGGGSAPPRAPAADQMPATRIAAARPHSPAGPAAHGGGPMDDASSPQFAMDTTLAVAVIRGVEGAAPPLNYTTISAPLDTCTVEALALELCPDIVQHTTVGEQLNLCVVVGDSVLPSAARPLSALGVRQGTVMYILTGGCELDDRVLEVFRVRSLLDDLIRRLRMAEAAPRRPTDPNPAADTESIQWSHDLTTLLLRLDRLDNLPAPLRQQRRRTCADACLAEEMIDRLRSSRSVARRSQSLSSSPQQGTATSPALPPPTFAAATSGTADARQLMSDEPWLLYNLSQRFYDSLLAAFAAFDLEGRGVLNRPQITRLCRWMNLPSEATIIGDLFTTFCGPSQDASVPRAQASMVERTITFHQLCLWVQRQQRRPLHDYGLTFDRYYEALDLAHALDTDRSGGLKPEEAVLFLRRFAAKDATAAAELIDSVVTRRRAHLASMSSPARDDEELSLDIILRVLCSEAQGWDVCDTPVDATTPGPSPGASAPVSQANYNAYPGHQHPTRQQQQQQHPTTQQQQQQRARGATTGTGRPGGFRFGTSNTTATTSTSNSVPNGHAPPNAPGQPPVPPARLRSATSVAARPQRREKNEKCCVA